MSIIVNKKRGADGIDTTAVHALSSEMAAFLRSHGRIVHTKEKRVFITLPVIFEIIDGSNVAIVRPMDTKAIPESVSKEFKNEG